MSLAAKLKNKRYRESHREEIREGRRKYYLINREKILAHQKEVHQSNPESRAQVIRKSRYGVTQETWEELIEEANGCCQICSRKEKLCIDHCHGSGKIRGLLCRKCNAALGLLKENTGILQSAINYLLSREQ